MDFIVGTFNYETLYTLHFSPPTRTQPTASLSILRSSPAIGGHSWLTLSPTKEYLYTTAWTKPNPSIAAYKLRASGREIQFLNAKPVAALSGYVCTNGTHLFSVGGPSGEVFRLEKDGSIGECVQNLDFVTGHGENVSENRNRDAPGAAHGSFGGLRHGAHSVDLSPDGRSLYVADIGRNAIFTYSVGKFNLRDLYDPPLKLGTKHISPRPNDGPRHSWPHPNGKVLYVLQEHTSMVDVFAIAEDGVTLEHKQGVKIIPAEKEAKEYWADEVRLDQSGDASRPKFMYASTRGLQASTKGYVAAFSLDEHGYLISETAIHIWETPTSGGLANAIEPAPPIKGQREDVQYLAMTDSEEGWVFMLSFDGKKIAEVARVSLGKTEEGEVVGAATAVWL
ncbi:muconate cycloisomerase I, MLE, partial [Neohortaea acidophila]